MIDHELKKKIVNTISTYELKCDKMQLQINAFKNIINQLIITSAGLNYEMDDHLTQLRNQLDAEFDYDALEKKVSSLAKIPEKVQKKQTENARILTNLMKQSTESIGRLAKRSHDKRAVSKLQRMLDEEIESQVILVHFNEVLTQCVSSVIRDLEEIPQISKQNGSQEKATEISPKVNESLQQLINHLSIPKDLDAKREDIKISLEEQLNGEKLSKIIDGLTELVVDAFNVEQDRFKGFLQQLTNQLHDFDIYLKNTAGIHNQASNESRQLEHGIQDHIEQIKNHFDNSCTIEELSVKVHKNLKMILGRIKNYRDSEKNREIEYQKQVVELQEKLYESEQNAEEIKSILSFQKYRINHDSLTGLPNRECYEEHVIDSIQRWKQKSKVLSLAIGDIDHFKYINDNFGHLAGDKVLKKVATIFKSSIRDADFIARIGGEEFVFIFENTSSKSAQRILEKLRKLIEDCQFFYRNQKVDVTVSFGLTTIIANDDMEALFMRADNAMYKAKNAGRNRVETL
ncbi:GGDEF domain-containing protein [Legionella antarctica]|uniref:diguanylate cyclase n=1 Tax=Legionella antarctica TaxID=2708020 RepID=A0A6F8T4G2_9GAMM|nr:GGDEF domain-containing protein [Legionella antarctica]BCA94912.1 GGDEF domain-containing protein [Legionella antarctica]